MEKRPAPLPVLGFAAYSGTGKTTLLKQLIPWLRVRGLRIGVVKLSHHRIEVDTPGKDSYELRRAGASQMLLTSAHGWALMADNEEPRDPDLEQMLARLDQSLLDLVLVEGFRHHPFPKIELHRPALGRPLIHPRDPHVVAVAADAPLPEAPPLPLLDLNRVADVGAFVLDWMEQWQRREAPPSGRTVREENEPMSTALKQELVRHYRWLRQYGNNDSHSGNASVRDGDMFWVTPTGACADTLDADDLVACPLQGPCGGGASLDGPLHQQVYQANPRARAVLHSHGPYTVAVTLGGEEFVPPDFEGQYYFPRVPVIDIPYDQYVARAPEAVARMLAEHRITVVRGHGVYACGETLNLAYKWTCSLELSAKTAVIARGL